MLWSQCSTVFKDTCHYWAERLFLDEVVRFFIVSIMLCAPLAPFLRFIRRLTQRLRTESTPLRVGALMCTRQDCAWALISLALVDLLLIFPYCYISWYGSLADYGLSAEGHEIFVWVLSTPWLLPLF